MLIQNEFCDGKPAQSKHSCVASTSFEGPLQQGLIMHVVNWNALGFAGGNLSSRIAANRFDGKVLGENELRRLLRHISMVGVSYWCHALYWNQLKVS